MGKIFADKLRKLMFQNALLPEELAEKLGVSKATIYCYLNGTSMPQRNQAEKVIKLAEILKCSCDELDQAIKQDAQQRKLARFKKG